MQIWHLLFYLKPTLLWQFSHLLLIFLKFLRSLFINHSLGLKLIFLFVLFLFFQNDNLIFLTLIHRDWIFFNYLQTGSLLIWLLNYTFRFVISFNEFADFFDETFEFFFALDFIFYFFLQF